MMSCHGPTLNREDVERFHEQGYLVIRNLLTEEQVSRYRDLYDRFLSGQIRSGKLRVDLGASQAPAEGQKSTEKITQIMWPSAIIPPLVDAPLHRETHRLSQEIYGMDMQIDFDMLINKAPYTNTITPWHQDAAYWVDLPDHRAVSFWVSLDHATIDNGCMWFVPGSHLSPLRQHAHPNGVRALQCEYSEDEGTVPCPLLPGDATIHHGRTLHYSRGNSTDSNRRAFIINCRPKKMIEMEREQGMDHGLTDNVSKVRTSGGK